MSRYKGEWGNVYGQADLHNHGVPAHWYEYGARRSAGYRDRCRAYDDEFHYGSAEDAAHGNAHGHVHGLHENVSDPSKRKGR